MGWSFFNDVFRYTERDVPCGRDVRFATMCPAGVKIRNASHRCDNRRNIAMRLHYIAFANSSLFLYKRFFLFYNIFIL